LTAAKIADVAASFRYQGEPIADYLLLRRDICD